MGKNPPGSRSRRPPLDRFADGVYLCPWPPSIALRMVGGRRRGNRPGLWPSRSLPPSSFFRFYRGGPSHCSSSFETLSTSPRCPAGRRHSGEASVKIVATSRPGSIYRVSTSSTWPAWSCRKAQPRPACATMPPSASSSRAPAASGRLRARCRGLEQIVRICRLVEACPWHPSGRRLAGDAQPGRIAAEVARSYDFLETNLRDLPERQRSMRAVFEYSWNLLNEREREIFSGLSVYCCNFTRDAAQQITGEPRCAS